MICLDLSEISRIKICKIGPKHIPRISIQKRCLGSLMMQHDLMRSSRWREIPNFARGFEIAICGGSKWPNVVGHSPKKGGKIGNSCIVFSWKIQARLGSSQFTMVTAITAIMVPESVEGDGLLKCIFFRTSIREICSDVPLKLVMFWSQIASPFLENNDNPALFLDILKRNGMLIPCYLRFQDMSSSQSLDFWRFSGRFWMYSWLVKILFGCIRGIFEVVMISQLTSRASSTAAVFFRGGNATFHYTCVGLTGVSGHLEPWDFHGTPI